MKSCTVVVRLLTRLQCSQWYKALVFISHIMELKGRAQH